MFRSYQFQGDTVDLRQSHVKDDDFVQIIERDFVVGDVKHPLIRVIMAHAVIETYEKRNLNVPANLALAFKWFFEIYAGKVSIEDIIKYNKRDNPLYAKYADDVDKYLMLM